MQAKQHLRFLLFVFTMALLYTGSIFVPGCTALASSSVSHARYGYTLELPNGWTPLWQEDADFQQRCV